MNIGEIEEIGTIEPLKAPKKEPMETPVETPVPEKEPVPA